MPQVVLAVDIGAESGRVMAVQFDGDKLVLKELHRFPNRTITVRGTLFWDILSLWREILVGIKNGRSLHPVSIGLDTWGVDFALLDAQGELLGNPVHYRDQRTEGMFEKAFSMVPKEEIFSQTGIQFLSINSLYQMLSLVEASSPQLRIADTFLTIPDLLNFWLTGTKACEFSNATTTQMFNPTTGNWAASMLEKLHIPSRIFPEIVYPGTKLGEYDGLDVIAPACHDTGSAVAAVPATSCDFAYISSGTWSLVGLEVDHPIIDQAALEANVTNEGGVYGTYRLLKNVMGLWIFQQCRATWEKEGTTLTYDAMVEMALTAQPLTAFVNVDDKAFLSPGNHPRLIREMCRTSGQPVPTTRGAIARLVLESLALAYRRVVEQLVTVSGQEVEVIHIIGGGSQNALLNQMTADATGIPVIAGPAEATVIGNALVQFITLGELSDIKQARQVVSLAGPLSRFEPRAEDHWNDAYQHYRRAVG